MLDNIKSSYILKNIFLLLPDEKRKLELVIYNKNLQKKLDINILHYKLFKGKYKNAEKKWKRKRI